MDLASMVVTFYGVFNLVGGVIGYIKAKSKASLIAGSVAGIALLICARRIEMGSMIASFTSLGIALLLGIRFLGTWLKTRRVMPDLLMILFSLATLVFVGLKVMRG